MYNARANNPEVYNSVIGVGQSGLEVVVASAEVLATVADALLGDEQAQASLKTLSDTYGETVLQVGKALALSDGAALVEMGYDVSEEAYTALQQQWEEADSLEMAGRRDEATQLRAKLVTDVAAVLITGVAGTAKVVAKTTAKTVEPTSKATGKKSDAVGGEGAEDNPPKVTAEAKVDGDTFKDTNQGARPSELADSNTPTLINDRVEIKTSKNPDRPLPNGNMATAHAEIGAIQQAFNAGKTQGKSMTLDVKGLDVCGFCKGDIAAAAQKAGLKNLEVKAIDNKTGLPKTYYWEPGFKSIREKK